MSKKALLTLFLWLTVLASPSFAQQKPDTTFTFRFVPQKDMFYVPFGGNDRELALLLECVEQNRTAILDGRMPLHVDGYCNSLPGEKENLSTAAVRSNRVKSELIVRGGINESCFITRNHASGGDIVTVRLTVPASVEETPGCGNGEETQPDTGCTEEESPAAEVPGKEERIKEEPSSMVETDESDVLAAIPQHRKCHLALRANLLRWATLTPDIGVEWRINRHVGIALNGTFTSWTWHGKERRYALWEVAPEIRGYLGQKKNGYIGAMYKAGAFNYKFSDSGKQGDLMGGGITGGYLLKLSDALSLDFNLGLGYVRADYDKYTYIDGMHIRDGKCTENWWGPTNAGVTLVWTLF